MGFPKQSKISLIIIIINMLAQFQKVLESPIIDNEQAIQLSQNLICTFIHQNFSSDQNIKDKISNITTCKNSPCQKLYRLIQTFIKYLDEKTVPIQHYQTLQSQTQKLESAIRNHIKIEYEMKMFMEHLQSKNQKLQEMLQRSKIKKEAHKMDEKQLQLLKSKQKVLMKQKIHLIKKNQQLLNKLQEKEQMLNYKYDKFLKIVEVQAASSISRKNFTRSHEKSVHTSNKSKESIRHGFTDRCGNLSQKQYLLQVNNKKYDSQLLNVQSIKLDKNPRYYTNQSDLTEQKQKLLPQHIKYVHPSTNDLTKKKSSNKIYYITKKPSTLQVINPYF